MTYTQKRPLSTSPREFYIESWQVNKSGIEANFVSNANKKLKRVTLPWMWLRDHCPCSECLTFAAQRGSDVFIGWETFNWQEVVVNTDGEELRIQWHDGHKSQLSYRWLKDILNVKPSVPVDERQSWTDEFPCIDYRSVVDTDEGLRDLVEHLTTTGVCKIVGASPSAEQSAQLMQRIAYLRQSELGDIVELTPSSEFNRDETHLHTDGAFNYDPPGIKLVQCLELQDSSCEIALVDGLELIETIRNEPDQELDVLPTHEVYHQYVGQDVNLIASGATIVLDDHHRLERICYNPATQISGALEDSQTLQSALQTFETVLREKSRQKTVCLNSGEILLWDNWRVLHGGSALDGNHHIAICTVNMEDFHSRLRITRNPSSQRPVPKPRKWQVTV